MTLKCTRQGCGKEYNEDNNVDNGCQFHAGAPVFHEGLKGWSCCKKRVSDFDEFLQIPGCTYGKHSNEKAVQPEPVKQQQTTTTAPQATSVKDGVEVYGEQKATATTVDNKSKAPIEKKEVEEEKKIEVEEDDDESIPVKVGTTCKRRGCGVEYKDNETSRNNGSESLCRYHPGVPIFHEGSKGWSCCSRKVLEFEEFLKIKGCKEGKHLFVGSSKKDGEQQEELVDCRIDWYQTQTNVIISIFAKNKQDSQIKFSTRSIDVDIKMKDNKRFKKQLPLFHLIDPDTSKFTVLSTKVEINLVKTNGVSWAALEPTKDVKTWTTFGVKTGGTGGTVGSKEVSVIFFFFFIK
ncbi:unnamed protein product [Cunninghamella echinulata]